jgi:DNA-binding SARP family transcriptional activator
MVTSSMARLYHHRFQPESTQAVALEPFRESGYRALMRLHHLAGDRAQALRVYERCRHLLAEELGAAPAPETEAVRAAVTG